MKAGVGNDHVEAKSAFAPAAIRRHRHPLPCRSSPHKGFSFAGAPIAGEHSSPLREENRWCGVGATCGRPLGEAIKMGCRERPMVVPRASEARLVAEDCAPANPLPAGRGFLSAPSLLLSKPNPLSLGFGLGPILGIKCRGDLRSPVGNPPVLQGWRASTARPYSRIMGNFQCKGHSAGPGSPAPWPYVRPNRLPGFGGVSQGGVW